MTWDDLEKKLRAATRGSHELDQMAWACETGCDFPLTHYGETTWESARNDGAPEARMTTDLDSALAVIDENHPNHEIEMRLKGGLGFVEVRIFGLGPPITGKRRGDMPVGEAALGLTTAFAEARGPAIDMEQRLVKVFGVRDATPPPTDWEIEELPTGRFAPVNHERRLAGIAMLTRDKAAEYAGFTRWTDYVVMTCRERYEEMYPAPDTEDPSP